MFGDSFFKKVEKKTNVKKETILSLASKLQNSNMKDEKTIRNLIDELSEITGREVSKEKSDKIVNAILNDNVPDVDKMF
ncbi:MAG: stage VI sporulation protein F [bacterium]|nr:stage VI sporulation protein F [bacterium]